jgi:aspartate kinase
VQKYGEVCLETPAKIRTARSLADLNGRGRVVAIVSAMGKTTDQLIRGALLPMAVYSTCC